MDVGIWTNDSHWHAGSRRKGRTSPSWNSQGAVDDPLAEVGALKLGSSNQGNKLTGIQLPMTFLACKGPARQVVFRVFVNDEKSAQILSRSDLVKQGDKAWSPCHTNENYLIMACHGQRLQLRTLRRSRPEALLAPVNAKSKCVELPLLMSWNELTPLDEESLGTEKSVDEKPSNSKIQFSFKCSYGRIERWSMYRPALLRCDPFTFTCNCCGLDVRRRTSQVVN